MKDCFRVSKKKSCEVIQLQRSVYYYQSCKDDQAFLKKRIKEIASTRVRYGYKRIHVLLQREGWAINRKRVYRLYKEEGLQLEKKKPWRYKRSKARNQRVTALERNQCWSMDFVSDQLHNGKRFRVLTIVDQFSRLSPVLEARFSYKAIDVVSTLKRIERQYGIPKQINVDNGPEFISKELDLWAYSRGVKLDFSRSCKPTDNAFIESFNGRFREECLNQNWFLSLEDVQGTLNRWRRNYNQVRPHSSLGYVSPEQYLSESMKQRSE